MRLMILRNADVTFRIRAKQRSRVVTSETTADPFRWAQQRRLVGGSGWTHNDGSSGVERENGHGGYAGWSAHSVVTTAIPRCRFFGVAGRADTRRRRFES